MRCFFFISVKLVAKGGGGEGETLRKSGHIQNSKLREKEHSLTGFLRA